MTKLIEFKNHKGEILRGLFDKTKSKKGIIFVHGFERTTVEQKFKNIVDRLRGETNLFRFDFSGNGLSDGEFQDLTVDKQTKELSKAVEIFKKISGIKKISFVAHSLGCSVTLNYLKDCESSEIDKVVFLAPGFNQKELHRYWFVKKDMDVNWEESKESFAVIENDFEKEMKKALRASKTHFISKEYFQENKDVDYQSFFKNLPFDLSKILIVHGDADEKVPKESNDKLPKDLKLILVDGDHDLQKPATVKQYLEKLTEFLKG